jgi:hypothetical protein
MVRVVVVPLVSVPVSCLHNLVHTTHQHQAVLVVAPRQEPVQALQVQPRHRLRSLDTVVVVVADLEMVITLTAIPLVELVAKER